MADSETFMPALFDRTVEQRKRHAEITSKLHGASPQLGGKALSQQADLVMLEEFFQDMDELVAERKRIFIVAGKDPEAAFESVCGEVALLNEVLPLPMIERLGGNE